METWPLPVQTSLRHRGGFGPEVAPLFPSAATFAALGGRAAIARLVDGLYDRVEADAVLRPAFSRDLTHQRALATLFFEAWCGGEPTYFDAAWREGLQVQHRAIAISRGMADRWVGHFVASFTEAAKDHGLLSVIRPVIERLALALVNRTDEPVPGERLRGRNPHGCSGADLQAFMQHVQRDTADGIAAAAAADPRALALQGPMLLLIAAVRGKARAAEGLLRAGVDANAPATLPGSEAHTSGLPRLPITPLCGALAKGRDAVVQLLVQHGAQYDIFTAACLGDLAAVRDALDAAPALANAHDPAGDVTQITPLLHAVFAGQSAVARLLLQRGATAGVHSVRLVQAAANRGDVELTTLLLAHGASPATIGAGDWVLYPAIADHLVARGANVNQTPGAWIGLCCTGNSGHTENAALAQALCRYGADVAARYKGRTALHCAARAGFVHVIAVLLEHGADVNALNEREQTPLDEVETAGRSSVREPVRRLLIAHGARRGSAPQDPPTGGAAVRW